MPVDYKSPGVYLEEMPAQSAPIEGVGTAIAAFVGLTSKGTFKPKRITNWTEFREEYGYDFVEGTYLAHAVYGYFLNGGGPCYVVRVGEDGAPAPAARAELPSAKDAKVPALRVAAREPSDDGTPITVDVKPAAAPPAGDATDTFDVVVKKGDAVETHTNLTTKKGKQNVATVVNEKSKLITVEEVATGTATEALAPGSVTLATAPAVTPEVLAPDDYIGSSARRTGFAGLEAVDEVTMLCVPDLMSGAVHQNGNIDVDVVKKIQGEMIAHCEQMGDRMAILDAPPNLTAEEVNDWRMDRAGHDSKFAALYWPWIEILDPSNKRLCMPASGHIAGVWARSDATRGVHKAPANEVVRGLVDLERNVSSLEQDLLNPNGINCLRTFSGRGTRIWGARTLATTDKSWMYINVRRLFNYIEESILEGTDWAVFEPNDYALWAKMRRTISAFLTNEWRKGALFGLNPEQAFYVKCDEETNPPSQVDKGYVTCEIGIAPVKPAEFVVFRVQQVSGGGAVSE
ncbi:MAG TPA: phage tail sheath subtilisin-like domain-containing protein [Actinomycetota bacterium]|nr:phage tail sheath subtilisin-like domain-containing protein [Actinomycetota bacterium]